MICELCGRDKPTTFHHLIPRTLHGNRRFRKLFSVPEMKRRGLELCSLCHLAIHVLIPDEKELGLRFNTRELLLADERIARHIQWARKQK